MEIVEPANSKKNNNIKANDFNLISMARSADQIIVRSFQCFLQGSSPFGKVLSHEPSPSPLERFRGKGGMDIFWNHMLKYS